MKQLFLILFLCGISLTSFAQRIIMSGVDLQQPTKIGHRDTIDQAVQLEVFFDQVDVDTILKSTVTYNLMLQLGEKYSQ